MPRGKSKKKRVTFKLPPQQRHALSVSYTRYVPPAHPPPREQAARWRRVVQVTENLTQDSSNPWKGVANVSPSSFFVSTTSLTGFDAFFLHRVTVWTGVVVPASGQTVWPTLSVRMADNNGQVQWPSYVDHAPSYNFRSRIGLNVPSHLSGPYMQNSTKRFIDIEVYNEGAQGRGEKTVGILTVVLEIDATFV